MNINWSTSSSWNKSKHGLSRVAIFIGNLESKEVTGTPVINYLSGSIEVLQCTTYFTILNLYITSLKRANECAINGRPLTLCAESKVL